MNTPCNNQNNSIRSESNVFKMGQTRIVRSVREKCGLIDHLFSDSLTGVVDTRHTEYNKKEIDDLVSAARYMLSLIKDDYEYMEAASAIERVLVKMNRFTEASLLYTGAETAFHH